MQLLVHEMTSPKDIPMGLPPLHWFPVLVASPLAVAYYWGDRISGVVLNVYGDRSKTDTTSFFAMYLANIELIPRE
jgi:hypothetical protein